ncbi:dispanin subfamily A member 2b-like [Hoplias malabaricus]|uniref:dispanin subfamily A member 2b-like n=1 Tax=Hoplias malabaricus TaxID=27720 RepID=UPI003462F50C
MTGGSSASNAPTYLGWSIFNTLCCCLPLGIAAIVFSCRADTANTVGDGSRAHEHSRTARNLNIAALVIGIIFIIIIIVVKVLEQKKHG